MSGTDEPAFLEEIEDVAAATMTPSLTIELDIKLIRVREDRRKTFDKADERNQHFINSVEKVGILQPIDVRQVGDRYEVVFGRRRLWAARHLGMATIPCKISHWSDSQVN